MNFCANAPPSGYSSGAAFYRIAARASVSPAPSRLSQYPEKRGSFDTFEAVPSEPAASDEGHVWTAVPGQCRLGCRGCSRRTSSKVIAFIPRDGVADLWLSQHILWTGVAGGPFQVVGIERRPQDLSCRDRSSRRSTDHDSPGEPSVASCRRALPAENPQRGGAHAAAGPAERGPVLYGSSQDCGQPAHDAGLGRCPAQRAAKAAIFSVRPLPH